MLLALQLLDGRSIHPGGSRNPPLQRAKYSLLSQASFHAQKSFEALVSPVFTLSKPTHLRPPLDLGSPPSPDNNMFRCSIDHDIRLPPTSHVCHVLVHIQRVAYCVCQLCQITLYLADGGDVL